MDLSSLDLSGILRQPQGPSMDASQFAGAVPLPGAELGQDLSSFAPMSGMDKFKQALQLIIPLIAAAGAYKKGALGSFTGGMMDVRQQQTWQQQQEEEQRRQEQEEQRAEEAAARARRGEQRTIAETEWTARARQAAEQEKTLEQFFNALRAAYPKGIPAGFAESTQAPPIFGDVPTEDVLKRGMGVLLEGNYYLPGMERPEPKTVRVGGSKPGTFQEVPLEPGKEYPAVQSIREPKESNWVWVDDPKNPGQQIQVPAGPGARRTGPAGQQPKKQKVTTKYNSDGVVMGAVVDDRQGHAPYFSVPQVVEMLIQGGILDADEDLARSVINSPDDLLDLIKETR